MDENITMDEQAEAKPKTSPTTALGKAVKRTVSNTKTGARAASSDVNPSSEKDIEIEKQLTEMSLRDTGAAYEADVDADSTPLEGDQGGDVPLPIGSITSAAFEKAFSDILGDDPATSDQMEDVAPAPTGGDLDKEDDPKMAEEPSSGANDGLPKDTKHFLKLYDNIVQRYMQNMHTIPEENREVASLVISNMLRNLEDLLFRIAGLE